MLRVSGEAVSILGYIWHPGKGGIPTQVRAEDHIQQSQLGCGFEAQTGAYGLDLLANNTRHHIRILSP